MAAHQLLLMSLLLTISSHATAYDYIYIETDEFDYAFDGLVETDCNGFAYAHPLDSDAIFGYYNIDFGNGSWVFQIRYNVDYTEVPAATVSFHLDSEDGEVIATTETPFANSDWCEMVNTPIQTLLLANVSGVHDFYMSYTGTFSSLPDIDWIEFLAYRSAWEVIEAETFDYFYDGEVQNCAYGDEAISYVSPSGNDSVITYLRLDFGEFSETVRIRLACGSEVFSTTFIRMTIDSVDGPEIAAFSCWPISSDSCYFDIFDGSTLHVPSGIHDVYVSFVTDAPEGYSMPKIDWFQFSQY